MFKQAFKKALIGSGAMRLASRMTGSGAAIIMYHSVQDDPAAANLDQLGGIIHSAKVFQGQMEIIAHHFTPVTLEQILGFLGGDKALPQRPVVVTFDDGYRDNFHVAKPILDKVGIPGVFYVAVDCIQHQSLPWPSQLRHTFLTGKAASWADSRGTIWPLGTRGQRLQAFDDASKQCARLAGQSQKDFLESVRGELHASPLTSNHDMMSWGELRALDRAGHIVGSHTVTHPNMAQISPELAEVEFAESKRRLEEELGKPVAHFSYPCPALEPHWSDQTVGLSRKLGYLTGVTTNGGLVRQADNALALRRIRPTKTVDGVRWNLECTFAGRVV
jgi:peptidoglycan/xylan/chitin deacetylase (PgdA/CDA1 family)